MIRIRLCVVGMSACFLLAPAAAVARQVTLGALDPTPHDTRSSCGYDQTIYVEGSYPVNQYSAEPPPPSSPYVVPSGGGTITSWTVSQLGVGTEVRLAVVSFGPGARSLVVNAYSPIETISPQQGQATVTFPVHIPVSAGEEIGLDVYGTATYDCAYPGANSDQVYIADDGQTSGTHSFGTLGPESGSLVNLEATLQTGKATHKHRHRARHRHRRHRARRRTAHDAVVRR